MIRRLNQRLHHAVLIEVQDRNFAVFETQFKAVQPKSVILCVREPGTGLRLSESLDRPFDDVGPRLITHRSLLSDPNLGARRQNRD